MITLTFPATPAQFQQLFAALQATGTEITAEPDGSYEIKGHTPLGKIEATARYTEPTLSVVVTKHGWNPIEAIEREIQQTLAARYS